MNFNRQCAHQNLKGVRYVFLVNLNVNLQNEYMFTSRLYSMFNGLVFSSNSVGWVDIGWIK